MGCNSKWNPFGNYDNPVPPDWYLPNGVYLVRWLGWFFVRNPLHNFMAYWIGFRDKDWKLSIWKDTDGLNVVLPFISYRRGRFECYIGWRPDSRMFGFSIRWHKRI